MLETLAFSKGEIFMEMMFPVLYKIYQCTLKREQE